MIPSQPVRKQFMTKDLRITFNALMNYCIKYIDVPVITTPEPRCNDFDVRLANVSLSSQDGNQIVVVGTVEICNNGSYFSICDVGWNNVGAQLICNALGYTEPYFRKSHMHANIYVAGGSFS